MTMLACALAHAAMATVAQAQQSRVGRIEKIAELQRGPEPVRIDAVSDRVQIRRGGTEAWTQVGPAEDLFLLDRLRVLRYVDVRFKVERPTQRGWLTFLPEVLLQSGGRVFDVGGIARSAEYSIPADTSGRSELAISIESGALIVDWRAGRLRVDAAGHTALVTGTIAVFAMDSAGDRGYLFVEEGTVSFATAPDVAVRAGEIATLQRGIPPAVSAPQPSQLRDYRLATRYNAQQVWAGSRPFWARPQFFVPALGIVAGGTAYALTRNDNGGRRPVVIVRIPF